MKRHLLLIVAAICTLSAYSEYEQFVYDGLLYTILSSEQKQVSVKQPEGSHLSGDLEIPAEVPYENSMYTVDGIAGYGFCDSDITSVKIPNSLNIIGPNAFYGCSNLTSVNIPNSVTWIGLYAFAYCSSLVSVEIPNSVTEISDFAFRNCYGLTSIKIPDSVYHMGRHVPRLQWSDFG